MTKRAAVVLLLAAALALSACSIGGGERSYRVLAPQPQPVDVPGEPLDVVLAVARPRTDQTRDSSRILVRRGRSLMPWAGVAWNDRAPALVQDLLIEALDGRVATVGRHGTVTPSYRLDLVLRHFELVEADNALEAELVLSARLLDTLGVVVGSLRIDQRVPVEGQRVEASVAAMEAAMNRGFGRLAAWLRETLAAAD